MTDDRTARLQRMGVLMVIAVALLVFVVLRSTLERPSGDGLPGPRPACERGQSTAHTVGRASWCDE